MIRNMLGYHPQHRPRVDGSHGFRYKGDMNAFGELEQMMMNAQEYGPNECLKGDGTIGEEERLVDTRVLIDGKVVDNSGPSHAGPDPGQATPLNMSTAELKHVLSTKNVHIGRLGGCKERWRKDL